MRLAKSLRGPAGRRRRARAQARGRPARRRPVGVAGAVDGRPGGDQAAGLGGREGLLQRRLPADPRRAGAQARARRRLRDAAGCRTSRRGCTRPARPPTRRTSRPRRSGWPGSARSARTSPAPWPRSTRCPRPAAATRRAGSCGPRCCSPAAAATSGSSTRRWTASSRCRWTGSPASSTPSGSSSTRSSVVLKNPSSASADAKIGSYDATEVGIRAGLERAYRALARDAPDFAGPGRAGQPGQRRAYLDADMSDHHLSELRRRDRRRREVLRELRQAGRRSGRGRDDCRRPGPAGGRPRQRADQRAHPHHSGHRRDAGARRAAAVRELRRHRRPGHLLRAVRHQAAERARPLPGDPGALGRRRLRPRDPAHPQRGRDGAAGQLRRRGSGRCSSSSTGSPTPTTPTRRPWPAREPHARCSARRCPRGMGTPESRLSAVTSVFADAVDAANDAVVAVHPGRARSTRRRRRSSPRSSRAPCCRTPTSATPGPTGCPTAARGSSSASTTRPRSSRSRPACPGWRRSPGPRGTRSPAGSVGTRPTSPRGSGRSPSTPTAGCWSAPTACGTTPPSPTRSSPRSPRPATSEPAALALALTEFANAQGGQDNITVALRADCRAECRSTRRPSGEEGVRWLSSPPPSTRTSSLPTAAPTSTRS